MFYPLQLREMINKSEIYWTVWMCLHFTQWISCFCSASLNRCPPRSPLPGQQIFSSAIFQKTSTEGRSSALGCEWIYYFWERVRMTLAGSATVALIPQSCSAFKIFFNITRSAVNKHSTLYRGDWYEPWIPWIIFHYGSCSHQWARTCVDRQRRYW